MPQDEYFSQVEWLVAYELTDKQLYSAMQYARSQDENAGRAIIEQFGRAQPALAHTVLNVFPALIASKDQNVAHLFMDLCFDVLYVFQHAYGALPHQNGMDISWLEKSAALLDAELQAFLSDEAMDTRIRDKLQVRFAERMIDSHTQRGLVELMSIAIDEHAIEQRAPQDSIRMAKSMIFVVIRLFEALYQHSHSPKP